MGTASILPASVWVLPASLWVLPASLWVLPAPLWISLMSAGPSRVLPPFLQSECQHRAACNAN